MENPQKPGTLAAIDIGAGKVSVVVGETDSDGLLRITGFGKVPAEGFELGTIREREAAVQSLRAALQEAQATSGQTITLAGAALTARGLRSVNKESRLVLARREVTRKDLEQAVKMAASPEGAVREGENESVVVHELNGFALDRETVLQDNPEGQRCDVLRASVHVAVGSSNCIANLVSCVRSAGVDIEGLVLQPWASAKACLTPTERELGVVCLDFGAGSIHVACCEKGRILHTAVFPMGGALLTRDIAASLRCPLDEAERIKLRYGRVRERPDDWREPVRYVYEPELESRETDVEQIVRILQPRVREIASLVLAHHLEPEGWVHRAAAGIVLTGGTAGLPGIAEVFQETTGLPVRIGRPSPRVAVQGCDGGQDSTAVGVLLELAHRRTRKRERAPSTGPLARLASLGQSFFLGDFWR